ncbi:MAG: 50S ribosomal protein L10 [Polyangiaceae bacterium]
MMREEKAEAIGKIKERFDQMTSAVFVDFSGMTVEEVTKLRDQFRAKGVVYRVVKNTLVKKALGDTMAPGLGNVLKGMTAVAWSFEEPSAAARIVKDFRKENEKLKIKAALLEGTVLDAKAVEDQLALLPSKDEARATLLATMMAPAQHMVMLLNAPARNLVGVLAAKQRQAEGG